jgi:hypothetical protein
LEFVQFVGNIWKLHQSNGLKKKSGNRRNNQGGPVQLASVPVPAPAPVPIPDPINHSFFLSRGLLLIGWLMAFIS